jgi:hypothetical protein
MIPVIPSDARDLAREWLGPDQRFTTETRKTRKLHGTNHNYLLLLFSVFSVIPW